MKRDIILLALWVFCMSSVFGQWKELGYPQKRITWFTPIGDSLLLNISGAQTHVFDLNAQKWHFIIELDDVPKYRTSDGENVYLEIKGNLHRLNLRSGIIQLLKKPTNRMWVFHFDPHLGLICPDSTGRKILQSNDFGESWNVLFEIEDISEIPDHSEFSDIQSDANGYCSFICKSNWQTHIVLYDEEDGPIELMNNIFTIYKIIIDSDSTAHFIDDRGVLYSKKRHEKYPFERRYSFQGDTFWVNYLLHAQGDSIIFERNNAVLLISDGFNAQTHVEAPVFNVAKSGEILAWDALNGMLETEIKILKFKGLKHINNIIIPPLLVPGGRTPFHFKDDKLTFLNYAYGHTLDESQVWQNFSYSRTVNGRIVPFRREFYFSQDRQVFKTSDFIEFEEIQIPFPTFSHEYDICAVGNEAIWISTWASSLVSQDGQDWVLDSVRPYIVDHLPLDTTTWLFKKRGSGSLNYITKDQGRTYYRLPEEVQYDRFIQTKSGVNYLYEVSYDTLFFKRIDNDVEILNTRYVILEECERPLAHASHDNVILLDNRDHKIYKVDLDSMLVERVDQELPKYSGQDRTLYSTESGNIYLYNDYDQFYLWEPSTTMDVNIPESGITLLENPGSGTVRVVIPEEWYDKELHLSLFSLSGDIVKKWSIIGMPIVEFELNEIGIFILDVMHSGHRIGNAKLINRP